MLAKQAWRIFKSPESLLSITLKARYFPNTLILKDAPGHSPFSRQSILWGQNLMKHGLIWKVGDGKSIQTIEDHWLLDFRFKFYSSSPPLEPNLSFFVSHLVPGRDPTKLRQFFDDHVVDRILHMPILKICLPLLLFTTSKQFWSELWMSTAPPEVKHLLWHVLSRSIPIASSLLHHPLTYMPLMPTEGRDS
ncbi:uncharacterized protein LOC115696699 [Cannabis sativa]|uniref:uncharacterized protein LOC115696699 n=1 Tax=Cannabis sativa TaxID=3483 RepID=UPI0011E05EA4|nr:uncharacterized protein LOC115696699 [Cannabis sativa]